MVFLVAFVASHHPIASSFFSNHEILFGHMSYFEFLQRGSTQFSAHTPSTVVCRAKGR